MFGIIYKAQNRINGKPYVGQTINTLKERIQIHLKSNGCPLIHNALIKYGLENFDIRVIDTGKDMNELNRLEVKYIKKHNSLYPNGYNLTMGGLNHRYSEKAKKKMSEAQKGEKSHWFGKHHSEETKKKLSEINKGKALSKKTRRKISESLKGEKNWNYGKSPSKETRKKLSESRKGHEVTEETRRKISNSQKGEKSHMYGKHHTEVTKRKISDSQQGERGHWAKLTEKQVEIIKWKILHRIPYLQIVKEYKIHYSAISHIKNRSTWKYIQIPKEYFLQLKKEVSKIK